MYMRIAVWMCVQKYGCARTSLHKHVHAGMLCVPVQGLLCVCMCVYYLMPACALTCMHVTALVHVRMLYDCVHAGFVHCISVCACVCERQDVLLCACLCVHVCTHTGLLCQMRLCAHAGKCCTYMIALCSKLLP